MSELFSKYIWLLLIFASFINALVWFFRGRSLASKDPAIKSNLNQIIKGYLFWGNLPWVFMGLGLSVGEVPSFWYFLRPQDADPWVLGWFFTCFLIWGLFTHWIFLKNGAQILSSCPWLFFPSTPHSPRYWKILCILTVISGLLAMVMLFFFNIPVPAMPGN